MLISALSCVAHGNQTTWRRAWERGRPYLLGPFALAHPLHHFLSSPPSPLRLFVFCFRSPDGFRFDFLSLLTWYPSNGPLSPEVELRSLKPRF
jgi:hypothetical protein